MPLSATPYEPSAVTWWWLNGDVAAPDRPALISADGEIVSRGALASSVQASARHLLDQGIERADRLALWLPPGTARAAALLAGMAVATVAPLTQARSREIAEEDLRRLRATRVVVGNQPPPEVLQAAEALGLDVIAFDPFRMPAHRAGSLPLPASDDIALVLQSSGTTSRPKVIPLSHANIFAGACSVVEVLALDSEDRALAAMPMVHIHGIVATLLAPLLAGGSVICCRERAVKQLVTQLTSLRPTWFSASPPLLLALADEVERSEETPLACDLRFLRSVTMPLASFARDRLEALFNIPVLEVYGMTEASSQVCSTRLPESGVPRRPGTVGVPAGPDVTVLNADGELCPPSEVGEVAIRGSCVTRGYEDEAQTGWHQDARGQSWFLTGDEGWFDEDGHLTLSGRLKEMINRGGMKVQPLRVDEALNLHPAVLESLSFGVSHVTLGEDVAAAVVLRAGASVGEEQLRDHLIEILPAHEVPSRILFVESLPRVATGKLRRRGLADQLAARLRSSGSPARGEMEQLVEDTFTTVLGVDCSGRDANFFMLGGDSLSSLDVINRLEHAIGIELNVAMLFLHPTVRTLAAEIEPLLAEEEARLPRAAGLRFDAPSGLFDRIARLQSLRTEAHPRAIPVAESWPEVGPPGCEVFPASFAQSRLWFLHQLEPGLTAYHLVSLWHLRGILDRSALQQALAGLIERHPVLRTSFRLRGDMVQQIIHPPFPLPLTPDRLGGRSVDAFVDDWLRKDQSTPFDLESGVLLRARLLEISHDEHLLLLNHHHIASDGWSRNVLCEDLSEFYNAACEDRAPVLPALCLHYQDYAVWQRERISGPRAEGLLEYWTRQLEGVEPLALPENPRRPFSGRHEGGAVTFRIGRSLSSRFEDLCRSEALTLHMGLLAVVALLLHRHIDQDDFAVGIPLWGRSHPSLEPLVGFFVNTLPIRTRFENRQSFRQLLAQVRRTSIEAYAHQELPFEQIVKALKIDRDLSRNPLVQVLLQFVAMPMSSLSNMKGLEVERLPLPPGAARFDLEFFIREDAEAGLRGEVIYDTVRFNAAAIEGLVGRLPTLIAAALQAPDAPTASLNVLPESEREEIETWQRGERAECFDGVVHELFERQAARTPEAVAIVDGDECLTYAELDSRANQLAHLLVEKGVGAEVIVAICLERSIALMVSVLAVLKAGGAYLPLDRAWPTLRRQAVLAGSEATLILTDESAEAFGELIHTQVVDPHRLDLRIRPDCVPRRGRCCSESLAYVLSTSGSTGRPKGVAMPHRSLVNLLVWQATRMDGAVRTLQFASLAFDVSFQEMFSTWLGGGTLVLIPDRVRIDPAALLLMLERNGIERLYLPVVMLGHLAEATEASPQLQLNLREVIVAGEQLRITPAIRRFFARLGGCRLWNHYGPTETHVATGYLLPPDPLVWPEFPPIGRPIANTKICLLDRSMLPVPSGVAGDLWIGGAAVARGYWRQPELTEERFIADPYPERPHALLYRSGDRARWRDDGQLEFLGRTDHQVKIRGHRVELGEIEAVLVGHPDVRSAAVVVRGATETSRSLVAFVTCFRGDELRSTDVRLWLRARLPDAMVPAKVSILPALPLNANGKLDRRMLESLAVEGTLITDSGDLAGKPIQSDRLDESYESTSFTPTLLEAELARVWRRLFMCEDVDFSADFFQMGGDSLMAVQMAVELERLLGRRIPIATLFEATTISSLARLLADESWLPAWKSLVVLHQPGSQTPLFVVHGMGGDVFYAHRFARLLGPDQPVYGIRADVIEGQEIPQGGVEEMARGYAREVQSFQPEGPYRLAGFSAGGWFAYALATELRREGHEVIIFVFDTNPICRLPWNARGAQLLWRILASISGLSHHTQMMSGMPAREWPQYLAVRASEVVRRIMAASRNTPMNTKASDRFTRAVRRFSAHCIEARVEFFQARAPWIPWLQAVPQIRVWRLLVRGPVRVHHLACRHAEIFSQQQLAALVALVIPILKDDSPP